MHMVNFPGFWQPFQGVQLDLSHGPHRQRGPLRRGARDDLERRAGERRVPPEHPPLLWKRTTRFRGTVDRSQRGLQRWEHNDVTDPFPVDSFAKRKRKKR